MRRRAFLARSIALPALAGLATRFNAPARIRFGCAAITWSGHDDVAIDEISALGFRGIQLRTAALERWKDPAALRDLLASRNLAFVAFSSGSIRLDPAMWNDDLQLHLAHARYLRDAGGAFLQVVDERPAGRTPTAAEYGSMARRLSELGGHSAELGVTLVYHNHMGALGQSPAEVEAILSQCDSQRVRLLLDIAHWQAAGGDPVLAVRQWHDRIAMLHLKDVRTGPSGANAFRFVELGRGEVKLPAVLAELRRVGFNGWGVVELDAVTEQSLTPRQCAQVSKDYLAAIGYQV